MLTQETASVVHLATLLSFIYLRVRLGVTQKCSSKHFQYKENNILNSFKLQKLKTTEIKY